MSDPAEFTDEDVTDEKTWNVLKWKKNKVGPSPIKQDQESHCLLHYDMSFPQMGLCLIIDVDNRGNARFSETEIGADVKMAKDTFEFLGFEVKIKSVKSSRAVKGVLREAAKLDHSPSSGFACVILIQEADATMNVYDSRDFTDAVTGDKCNSLVGKPKLFFVLGTNEERDFSSLETDSASSGYRKITKIPAQADLLYAAFIASGKNSDPKLWYLQSLHTILRECGDRTSLLTILTRINSLTAQKYEAFGGKDMAFFITMLTKQLVFPRKKSLTASNIYLLD